MFRALQKITSFVVVSAGCLSFSGCSETSQPGSQAAADKPKAEEIAKVTCAQFGHVFLYMPLYVAMRKGIFKAHGLDVSLISTGGDEKTFTAVATGNAQFGVSDPTFTAIAREHGQEGKVVACVVRGVPFWVVTLDEKISAFKSPSKFDGLRCASYTAPSTCYAVLKQLLAEGHADKAKIVQGAFGTLPALLKSKQADVAMEIEPTVSIIVGEGGHVVYSPKDNLGDFAFTGVEVSDSFAKEHPEQIKAFVAALKESMQFIHSDFEGALTVAQEEFPDIKPAVVKEALKRLRDSNTIPLNPELPKKAWDAAIDLRHKLGDLKSPGSYEENVDLSFLNGNK